MKKIFTLVALVVAASVMKLEAQTNYTLDLGSSFSPAWGAPSYSGTASNIGGSGINCTMAVALTGSGSIVSPYPRVNNNNSNSADFQVQGSTDAMEIDINLSNKTSYVDITYTFSASVQNLSFGISDIDEPGASSPFTYVDQVTVTGYDLAGNSVLPTLSKYNTSSTVFGISGNTATGVTSGGSNVSSLGQNNATQDGTMFVSFSGKAIKSITVRYTTLNAASVNADPGLQAIAVGNVTFQKAIAPVTTNVSNVSIKNTSGATAISGLAGTDDESVASFTIATLPSVTAGTLTYNNGTSYVAVTAGQVLTPAQAASLKFTPVVSYTGTASFTFTATDNRGLVSNTSTFSIPVTSSLLPVTFTSFTGEMNNGAIVLNWITRQEYNSQKFIVEKSVDGISWQSIGEVAAAGNSGVQQNYSITDAQVMTVNYYRLKEVDLDGSYIYSKVVKVSTSSNSAFHVDIYPNPVTSKATIRATSDAGKTVHIAVFNSNGVRMQTMTSQLIAGNNQVDIPNVSKLPAGMYTVMMDNGNNQPAVTRFIKQ